MVYVHIYIYIYIYVCVCVCACVKKNIYTYMDMGALAVDWGFELCYLCKFIRSRQE